MKRPISIFVFLFVLFSSAKADAIGDFVNSINVKWGQKDYTGINQTIADKLAGNSSDVLALSIKAYFNLFIGEISTAHAAAHSMLDAVNASNNTKAKEIAMAMENEVESVSTTESGPLTSDQKNKLHAAFPEMPMIRKCEGLARMIGTN